MSHALQDIFFASGEISAFVLAITLIVPLPEQPNGRLVIRWNYVFAGSLLWTTIVVIAKIGFAGIIVVLLGVLACRIVGHIVYAFMRVDGRDDFNF